MVESIDDGVGRLFETLEQHGLLDNTLVVFTSDNGGVGMPELGYTPTNIYPLRHWKGDTFEGGIRVYSKQTTTMNANKYLMCET